MIEAGKGQSKAIVLSHTAHSARPRAPPSDFLSQMWLPLVRAGIAGAILLVGYGQPQPLTGGCNVGGMTYYDTDLKACDLVKMGSPFGDPQGPWKGNAALDNSTGWPVEDFSISERVPVHCRLTRDLDRGAR